MKKIHPTTKTKQNVTNQCEEKRGWWSSDDEVLSVKHAHVYVNISCLFLDVYFSMSIAEADISQSLIFFFCNKKVREIMV